MSHMNTVFMSGAFRVFMQIYDKFMKMKRSIYEFIYKYIWNLYGMQLYCAV